MMQANHYNVIIVGAGIGGLVCGCFLAKAGLKVLIVEQHNKPGGCVSAIKRNQYIFDVGAHLFGSCNDDGILGQCLNKINVKLPFGRLNPTDRFFFPDDVIEVPNSVDEYISVLKKRFPFQKKQIDIFFKEIFWIARNFTRPSMLKKYVSMTYQDMLDTYIDNDKLKGILSSQYLYIGCRPNRASLLFMSVLLASYLKDGIYYPKGGSQSLPDALDRQFNKFGGKSIYNTQVKKILFNTNNRSKGVEVLDGGRFNSDYIILNSDAEKMFYNLIDTDLIPIEYLSKLKLYKKSTSLFLVLLALENAEFDISNYRGWHFDSYDMNNDAAPLYIFTPCIIDKSLAPDGISIAEALIEFPWEYNDIYDWHKCKNFVQNYVLKKIELKTHCDIKKYIYHIESASPYTFEKYTSNSQGAVYGWEMSVNQTGEKRLPQTTPFDNIFLVGHWTTPGCGVPSVAVSGWSLANKILSNKSFQN